MIAIDTNVLVRLLVVDDEEQAASARELIEKHEVWVSRTVLLESWVLRSTYGQSNAAVAEIMEKALGLPKVLMEDAEHVALALEAAWNGVEIADALHMVGMPATVREFATFDRRLAKRARSPLRVRVL
jgi:predicted nucleic-acid-binding protein